MWDNKWETDNSINVYRRLPCNFNLVLAREGVAQHEELGVSVERVLNVKLDLHGLPRARLALDHAHYVAREHLHVDVVVLVLLRRLLREFYLRMLSINALIEDHTE